MTQITPKPFCNILPVLGFLALSGCGSVLTAGTADLAGVAGAGIANSVTDSAAAATAIGLGVASGASAGLQYAERKVHQAEQDSIANAAGPLTPGAVGPWKIVHDVPIEDDEHGELAVVRTVGNTNFTCKEIVFSVDAAKDRAFYTATVCRDGEHWKWASAEPATERWGSLQ
jgi:hypothetical protein